MPTCKQKNANVVLKNALGDSYRINTNVIIFRFFKNNTMHRNKT